MFWWNHWKFPGIWPAVFFGWVQIPNWDPHVCGNIQKGWFYQSNLSAEAVTKNPKRGLYNIVVVTRGRRDFKSAKVSGLVEDYLCVANLVWIVMCACRTHARPIQGDRINIAIATVWRINVMWAWPRYVSAGYGLRLPAYQSWRIGSDRQCVGAAGVPTGHSAQLAGWPGVAVTYFWYYLLDVLCISSPWCTLVYLYAMCIVVTRDATWRRSSARRRTLFGLFRPRLKRSWGCKQRRPWWWSEECYVAGSTHSKETRMSQGEWSPPNNDMDQGKRLVLAKGCEEKHRRL